VSVDTPLLETFPSSMTFTDTIVDARHHISFSCIFNRYATILDAHKRLMKDPTNGSNWIPNRIQTWCAPASYTLHNLFTPPEFDWTKIAAEPVRFNCRDLGVALLDDPQCIEDISFADITSSNASSSCKNRMLSFAASEERIEENTGTFFAEYKKGGLPQDQAANMASEC
jgi:hypothetical protein